MLRAILDSKGMSLYKLEKESGVSHATLNDIYHEKSNVDNCSIIIIKKLADALHMSTDRLYATLKYENFKMMSYKKEFDFFKSETCHNLKRLGDLGFIDYVIQNKLIDKYFDDEDYAKSLYLLSMVDYLCDKNEIPLYHEYEELRECKLDSIYISESALLELESKTITYNQLMDDINPYFYSHNIIEGDIYGIN